MAFRIREEGEHHIAGDPNCPACQSPDGQHWPQPHQDAVSNCRGLVDVERFPKEIPMAGSSVVHHCDACGENPF